MLLIRKGFTLIELLVVIGIIGILSAAILVAVNPGRQFALARDSQRRSDLYSITNALYQYATENEGSIPSVIETTPKRIGTDPGLINLNTDLVPTFISSIPYDPDGGSSNDSLYWIHLDSNNRIVATAASELTEGMVIQVLR